MFLTRFLTILTISSNLIFTGVNVNGYDLSKLTVMEAANKLQQNTNLPKEINFKYNNKIYPLNTNYLDLEYKFTQSAQRAHYLTNSGNFIIDTKNKFKLIKEPVNLGLVAQYDNTKLNDFLKNIEKDLSSPPIYPEITIVNKKINFKNGDVFRQIDTEDLLNQITNALAYSKTDTIEIKTKEVNTKLNDQQIDEYVKVASTLIGKNITLNIGYNSYKKVDRDLVKLINPNGGYNIDEINNLINEIAQKEERDPQNPKFVFDEGRVSEFAPSLDGVKIDKEKLTQLIISSIEDNLDEIEIPINKTPPDVTMDKINNLGIKELIGRGTSTYFHSIPGRVHNVSLAASRINGTLVAPNETFSFNKALGDVSKFTGYQSAYVILSGKTVLGDGGGVCQVSSTLFRAVLNAGLPIDQRVSHAYRVGYYEQGSSPGFDATVYAPSPDFKFTNNTNNYILIEAIADPKNYSLVFELYGTKDGRVSKISKPIISNQSAPGPDVYQDDPTLPAGTLKQVEYRAYGAKVSFDYEVTKEGEVDYKKTFVSNYRPWNAVYLRGTAI